MHTEEKPKSEGSWTARGEYGLMGRHRIQVFALVARFERRTDEGWETLVEIKRDSPEKRFSLDGVPHPARVFFADHFELFRKLEAGEPIGEPLGDEHFDEEPFSERLARIAAEKPPRRHRSSSRWL